jgi:hypothetical protein
MLKKLLNLLNRDLTGRSWEEEAIHPYFGKIVLFAFGDSDKSYWEAELDFEGEQIWIALNAPDKCKPTESQVIFVKNILENPDQAFAKAAPILVQEFETWHKEPFPEHWRSAFKLVGMTIPMDGNESEAWELSYDSLKDPTGHQFTCYFERGKPSHASVDG